MEIIFHKIFQKKLRKCTDKDRVQLKIRLNIFVNDSHNIILNNHTLHGKYLGYQSINISGDLRAIYKIQDNNIFLFVDIDNHANLYK